MDSTRKSVEQKQSAEDIAVVPIKWVVTDKGDANRPKVRCRLVVRELRARTKGALLVHELFSAMPP